jgi:hypothetical protein
MFWFNIYFLTNRLILSDILSRTRIISNNSVLETIIIDNGNGEREIKVKMETKKPLIVDYGDKIISYIEKFNNLLREKNRQLFRYLKSKIKK